MKRAIEPPRCRILQRAFRATRPNPLNHLKAGAPPLEKCRDQCRWMLTVAVHDDDGVAARRKQTGEDCGLMAEVPREPKSTYTRNLRSQPSDLPPRFIAAAIVHDDDFDVDISC